MNGVWVVVEDLLTDSASSCSEEVSVCTSSAEAKGVPSYNASCWMYRIVLLALHSSALLNRHRRLLEDAVVCFHCCKKKVCSLVPLPPVCLECSILFEDGLSYIVYVLLNLLWYQPSWPLCFDEAVPLFTMPPNCSSSLCAVP